MYKRRNTRHLRTKIPKFSQVKSKDHYENISGIGMRPCEKKPVKMCAITTKYVLKMYQKGIQIDSKCIINVQKTNYSTFGDIYPKIFAN